MFLFKNLARTQASVIAWINVVTQFMPALSKCIGQAYARCCESNLTGRYKNIQAPSLGSGSRHQAMTWLLQLEADTAL